MSTFVFYAPSRVNLQLKYSLNFGSQTMTWSKAAGIWTDKTIEAEQLQFTMNNDFNGNPHRRYMSTLFIRDPHRDKFIEGLYQALKSNTFPVVYTDENGGVHRGINQAIIELVDLDANNITLTKKEKKITSARVKIENLLDSSDLSDFDTLCWNMNIPTINKNPNELYLGLINIAINDPDRILDKVFDSRQSIINVIKRAKELSVNGEKMVHLDVHTNKWFCYDNPSQAFMNEDSIIDAMTNDPVRFESFSKKVAELYSTHFQELKKQLTVAPKKKYYEEKEKPNYIETPVKQRSPEANLTAVEFEQKLEDIFSRIKDADNKVDDDAFKKEITELKEYYITTNQFVDESKANMLYEDVLDRSFKNYKQKQKWSVHKPLSGVVKVSDKA